MSVITVAGIKLITDAKLLASEGRDLAKSILDNDQRIGIYLLSEIAHIEEHRNPTRLNMFFSAITGSGARVNAMHVFIRLHANVSLNEDAGKRNEKGKVYHRKEQDGTEWDEYYSMRKIRAKAIFADKMTAAREKPWFKYAPERDPSDFVLKDSFQRFMTSLGKQYIVGAQGSQKVVIEADFLEDLAKVAIAHGIPINTFLPEKITVGGKDVPAPAQAIEVRKHVMGVVANTNDETDLKLNVGQDQNGNPIEQAKAEQPKVRRGRKAA